MRNSLILPFSVAFFALGLTGSAGPQFDLWTATPGAKEAPHCVRRADGVVELPVSFAPGALLTSGHFTLARWDLDIEGDFSDALGVEFDFRADDLTDFSAFMFHFFSGPSVRSVYFEPDGAEGAWRHVRVPRSGWMEDGKAFDWMHVTKLRLHANVIPGADKGKMVKFEIRNLSKWRGDWSVVFVEPESLVRETPAQTWTYRNAVNEVIGAFAKLGLDTPRVRDYELAARQLADAKVVVLPKNPKIPSGTLGILRTFVARGGRVVAFFDADPKIMEKAGLEARMVSRREMRQEGGEQKLLKRLAEVLVEVRPDLKDRVVAARRNYLAEESRMKSFLASLPSRTPERRAVWCHRAYGLYDDMDWETSAKELAALGITDLLVNLAWGGIAYYDSKVLPVSPKVASRGDALGQCVAACHRHGIRVHAWKVSWKLSSYGSGNAGDFETLRREGRLSFDAAGREANWLCQTDPRNQDLEIAALCELAGKKGLDGIHLDYIRFNSRDYCFCDGCRKRFEGRLGRTVPDWPKAVRDESSDLGAKWRQFRRDAITRVVAETSRRVRAEHPGVMISAATRGDMVTAREWDGQDWPLWCERGYLDFACPMDYAECWTSYRNVALSQRRRLAGTKTQLLPGLGLSCWQADGREAERLAKGIRAVRERGFPGFAIYEVDRRGHAVMRRLADGPLRSQDGIADTNGVKWVDGKELPIEGRAFDDVDEWYDRLPSGVTTNVNEGVRTMKHHTSGMMFRFVTDSKTLKFRWKPYNSWLSLDHMPSTGVSGIDVYRYDAAKGRWIYAKTGRIRDAVKGGSLDIDWTPNEPCLVNLPLYNGLKSFALGVDGDATVRPLPPRKSGVNKSVVFYGTSITHGGCCSRPGLSFVNWVGRDLDVPVVGLGFSGAGVMELEMSEHLARIDASCYILDCVRNMPLKETRKEPGRSLEGNYERFIRNLRAKRPDVPIIMAEQCDVFCTGPGAKNRFVRALHAKLTAEGWTKLHLLTNDEMFTGDGEGTVDGLHPNDLGMQSMKNAFGKAVRQALKMNGP